MHKTMRYLTKSLTKKVLRNVLSNKCNSRIPRSGSAGQAVNCFIVAIDKDSQPYLILTDIAGSNVTAMKWDGESYRDPKHLDISDVDSKDLVITHYYGLAEVIYFGVYDYFINRTLRWPYIKIGVQRILERTGQFAFNKQKLVTQKRVELLKFMIDEQLEKGSSGVSLIELMSKLYSIKWVLHPEAEIQQNKLEFYLDSLIATRDIEEVNGKYIVKGYAITNIEMYEEEERRHQESVKMQKRAFWLSVVVGFLALVQAEVIKLPTLLDLSGKENGNVEIHNKSMQPTTDASAALRRFT
ncbi:hypothetical protein TDB9533_03704 [Thalassocella blandensis]|nr:hypothetical protein TDB9533_03704 [Thalassocella blandensis]